MKIESNIGEELNICNVSDGFILLSSISTTTYSLIDDEREIELNFFIFIFQDCL